MTCGDEKECAPGAFVLVLCYTGDVTKKGDICQVPDKEIFIPFNDSRVANISKASSLL
jgi:hypothetical protein